MAYIVTRAHSATHDKYHKTAKTYEDAVNMVHKFFLSYDYEIKDGKPYDSGNDDGKDGGFKCFSGVKMYKGKVAEFTHCDGDGPVCEISKG